MDAPTQLNQALTEIYNLMLDGAMKAVNSIRQIHTSWLEDTSQVEDGLKPGTPIKDTPIDMVFVGSCTNGRIEDFREVAKILEGRKVAENIKVILVPGSEAVRTQCINEGLDKIFEKSGANFRKSGCSMCLAMNGDFVPAGKRCASTSNPGTGRPQ